MSGPYDALLVVSFGGPECREDVLPFLENVLRGKRVSRERMLEVAEHYYTFDGVSPINARNRELIAALKWDFEQQGWKLPIYWGNRNWHPLLSDTVRTMKEDGVRRALAFVTSIFSSYSGCRQYLEDLEGARGEVGADAPVIDKLRSGFNHPRFIAAMADRVQTALDRFPKGLREKTLVIFTAHSIPLAMADRCPYVPQLQEACRLVADAVAHAHWTLVYQSRSGPPQHPWLEPALCDFLRNLPSQGTGSRVLLVPIGFISDHMEVLYDLDTEARQVCDESGFTMTRAETAGTHPEFIAMIRELVQERMGDHPQRKSLGRLEPSHDVCPADCCSAGSHRAVS